MGSDQNLLLAAQKRLRQQMAVPESLCFKGDEPSGCNPSSLGPSKHLMEREARGCENALL